MKRRIFIVIFLFACGWAVYAQLLPELNVPQLRYVVNQWPAKWVTCADIPEADYAIVMFRRSFSLAVKPEQFVVHVSADNRYKLYVNGRLSAIGPQGSDWRHWRYETIDIAPYLQAGDNIIAAEVENWGPDRFFGIMSIRTAFMMQGATEKEAIVNTTANSAWKAKKNDACKPIAPNWIYAVDVVGGFYATNPGDSVAIAAYPKNWISASFDDAAWQPAKWIWNISNENQGGFFWLMKPRTTPQVAQTRQPFKRVARSEGVSVPPGFLKGETPLVIPPHSKASLLFDYETVTLGFPELLFSGGKGGKITIRYAENLYNPDRTRGDRNVTEGKQFIGVRDAILPDGSEKFLFTPTWYRAFRYVKMDVETTSEPLTIHDYVHQATMSPLKRRATFDCNDPVYKKIDEICWRTAAICTQDNLMSDAYYEQMMYVGDSWVHALINLYMTGDDVWMRNAIEQFDYSRMPDGNITSCYPLKSTFIHPTYSLAWIDMLYDFMMHCNDRAFLRKYVQSVRSTLAWFDNNLLDNGLVGEPVGSYFIDWYVEPPYGGEPPGSKAGNSAVVTLYYAATLLHAAALFEYLELPGEATVFRLKAEKVKSDVIAACWDDKKRMFAERPDKQFYDERTNIMAIVAQVFDEALQKELFNRCIADTTISKPSYYFIANHFNVMRRIGEGAQLDKVLNIWKALIPLNMTTTPERTGDRQRSDAHPWSAAPCMAFINIVAGITPAEPGFKSVSIEPSLGALQFVKASYPHYTGDIKVDLKKSANNGLEGSVELPKGMSGTFKFNGKIIGLKEGIQQVFFSTFAGNANQSSMVKINKTPSGAFELTVNGKPVFVKGAVGSSGIELVKRYGGNGIRSGYRKEQLDEAHSLGLTVLVNLPVMPQRNGFDYEDAEAVKLQHEKILAIVREVKSHPAVLMWALGNELDHVPQKIYEPNKIYYNMKVWDAVNALAKDIHAIDPDHPVMTVVGSISKHKITALINQCPDLDLLGVNEYGDLLKIPAWLREWDWKKPYMVTEWGPTGFWQTRRTPWGYHIEETSSEKADKYKERYEGTILADKEMCLGSYVFLWRQHQEYTHTWFGMFDNAWRETEAVDAMRYVWNGAWPQNRAPRVESMTINGKTARDFITLVAGNEANAIVVMRDPDANDTIRYEWELLREQTDFGYGGNGGRKPASIDCSLNPTADGTVRFTVPSEAGPYRLFVAGYDNGNHVAFANIPFYVDDEKY